MATRGSEILCGSSSYGASPRDPASSQASKSSARSVCRSRASGSWLSRPAMRFVDAAGKAGGLLENRLQPVEQTWLVACAALEVAGLAHDAEAIGWHRVPSSGR
ncbi:hypothetical protein [Mycobacterium helveticum]|uniref:Uncharacterized protein n=1 Tax=Mycobacterium helveticum TaxID=2592811 RepID=A0A557XX79_9MYCO|nr:hypothetical protein [Mycobacterium helveticum]TVS85553.1 hypothetical protein FPZ46_14030 [Mycobacterium helveticum]TVS90713.1 hypothetical protein FPZ47_08305 [Mycobacterium helveticum]